MDNLNENDLDNAIIKLTKNFSKQYKAQPDPAIFEKIFNNDSEIEVKAFKAFKAWKDLINNTNFYKNVFFEDIKIQMFIEDYGGWQKFCMREKDEDKWIQKDFISRYKLYTKFKSDRQHRILPAYRGHDTIL